MVKIGMVSEYSALFLIMWMLLSSVGQGASIAESSTSRLTLFDSSDTGSVGVSSPIAVFVTFTNVSNNQAINGSCNLSIVSGSISNALMTFNGLGDTRYNFSVAHLPEGNHLINVSCIASGFGALSASDTASVRPNSNLTLIVPSVTNTGKPVIFSAAFSNASSGNRVQNGQCVMHFVPAAGDPLNPVMGQNVAGLFETDRSFGSAGVFSYSVNCTAQGLDPAGISSVLLVRNVLPKYSSFTDKTTTNFSISANVDDVFVTLANQHGKIRWLNAVNASSRDFDAFVKMGNNFVSVFTSGLGEGYNSSVEVVLFNAGSNVPVVAPGFFSSLSEIRGLGNPCTQSTQPACTDVTTVGSTISFKSSFPGSFALGADANLTTVAPQAIAQFTSMVILANYTNATSGNVITNAPPFNGECLISFSTLAGDPQNGVMPFYDSGVFQFMRQFSSPGTFSYNVTCQSDPFALRQGNGSFMVVPVSLPSPENQTLQPPPPSEVNPAVQNVPPGPVQTVAVELPHSRELVATSGGITTSFNGGEEVDVRINGVVIRAGIYSISDGMASARLGSQRGNLSQGQELMMDVDQDLKPDISLKVLGLSKDSAKVFIIKLREEEGFISTENKEQSKLQNNAGEGKKKPQPIQEMESPRKRLSWWWFGLLVIGLLALGRWYYHYNQRMRHRFL